VKIDKTEKHQLPHSVAI